VIVFLDSGVLGLLVNPIQDVSEAEMNEIYQCTECYMGKQLVTTIEKGRV
jgi:hypothetical protein